MNKVIIFIILLAILVLYLHIKKTKKELFGGNITKTIKNMQDTILKNVVF